MPSATWLDDLTAYLAAQGVGTVGTNLFKGQFPSDTLEGVLITPTGGLASLPYIDTERPRIQVLCRYKSFSTGWTKAYSIYSLLNHTQFSQGSSRIPHIRAVQPPFSLGQTDRQLWRIVNNYQVWLA